MHKRGWAAFAHAIKTGIQRRAVLRGSAAVLAGAIVPTAPQSASQT